MALVGESGSGKTVTAMSILRLNADVQYTGSIEFDQQSLLALDEPRMRAIRGREIAMIFQEPMTALNPLFSIGEQICEVLELHEGVSRAKAVDRAVELLELVYIGDALRRFKALPHQLSGGQRQRAMIAMALACKPRLLIADEPTTALDVTIQKQIVELLLDLQSRFGMAILLITHDLPLVRKFAQRVAVMKSGRIIEQASTEVLVRPSGTRLHPRVDCQQANTSGWPADGRVGSAGSAGGAQRPQAGLYLRQPQGLVFDSTLPGGSGC